MVQRASGWKLRTLSTVMKRTLSAKDGERRSAMGAH
jgi:hypothetical protein